MVAFEKIGPDNTKECVRLALQRAIELDCDVVASSTFGGSAEEILKQAQELGFKKKVVIVRGCSHKLGKGINQMTPEVKKSLEDRGAIVVTAGHALSAGERGMSLKYKGYGPLEIMADTYRTFGMGTKVAVECSIMALEDDAIRYGENVVAMGGSGRGVDTALVVMPAYSAQILETVVREVICKPWDLTPPQVRKPE